MPKKKAEMPRREFLQLAQTYDPHKHDIAGWYASHKLDGQRAFWDGGVSRGVRIENVPYASVFHPKTGEAKKDINPSATGLWSRYGNPIIAPDWFLDALPACPLDGELWAGVGTFQLTSSIVRRDTPDTRWTQVRYACYGAPSMDAVLQVGEIKNANFWRQITPEAHKWWFRQAGKSVEDNAGMFHHEYNSLQEMLAGNKVAFALKQVKLDKKKAKDELETLLHDVLAEGGEGVMLRDPESYWTPKRVNHLLKYKPYQDDEAKVVGFVAGREGKQGNVLGKIGALIVRWNDSEFELGSGLTMDERLLTGEARLWAEANPGKRMPDDFDALHFRVGDHVTFKYRELTDAGIPKEGRYFRKAVVVA
jgi:DNA ligase-1